MLVIVLQFVNSFLNVANNEDSKASNKLEKNLNYQEVLKKFFKV